VTRPIEPFATGFEGRGLEPGEDGYESARRVWNGMIDKHPRVIVEATGIGDAGYRPKCRRRASSMSSMIA
jgi:hypothetical protein